MIVKASDLSYAEREAGAATLQLLRTWKGWVHRRVEAILLEEPETIRRQVSVDFTLPADLASPLKVGNEPLYFVPLTFLRKQPLTRFDLREENGGALPHLTKRRNGRLAAAVLLLLAEELADRAQVSLPVPDEVVQDLWDIANAAEKEAVETWRTLASRSATGKALAWRTRLTDNEGFMGAARTLASNFIVAVPLVGAPGRRRIIKFAYERHEPDPRIAVPARLRALGEKFRSRAPREERTGGAQIGLVARIARAIGWGPKEVLIEAPALVQGQSYHLEVEAPEGLEVTAGDLVTTDLRTRSPGPRTSVRRKTQRVHLYLADVPQGMSGSATVTLRPRASTIVRGATLTALFTVAVLMAFAVFWESDDPGRQYSLPGLLLVLPSILAGYVARPREPSVTTAVLFGLRIVTVIPAFCAFAAAAVIVLGPSCSVRKGATMCEAWDDTQLALWVLAGATAVTAVVLARTWTLIRRPPEQRQK